uniref:SFRICE_029735 n=1 Tax=Spodoptera frugiperda TaxID=7108 RepID=A0A2H1WGD7_SPOFR
MRKGTEPKRRRPEPVRDALVSCIVHSTFRYLASRGLRWVSGTRVMRVERLKYGTGFFFKKQDYKAGDCSQYGVRVINIAFRTVASAKITDELN